jgi:(5-formylfuran-3-yl)methyl phosphate synthase
VRLLVSVVSADEARLALAGGADIIDVKDPSKGALGAPSPLVLSEVVAAVGDAAPVSVALGDDPGLPHTAALAACGANFVKVGLSGVSDLERGVALLSAVADTVGPDVAVIACAFADVGTPEWLPALVARTGIAGALVDTFVKDGRGLYGSLSEAELSSLIGRVRDAGGSFAVAGQLRLGSLRRVDADVVGVRSAVCRGGERTALLEQGLVATAVAEVRNFGAGLPHMSCESPKSIG